LISVEKEEIQQGASKGEKEIVKESGWQFHLPNE